MRRAPFVLGASVAGLAAVLSYHTRTRSSSELSSSAVPAPKPAVTVPKPSSPGVSAPGVSSPGGSATGTLEQYGYGELSVRVNVGNGRITSLAVATLRTADSYSQQIALGVIPMLKSEVLKAQSTKVYGVTGATYTSEAYVSSIQSALDHLHFK